MPRAFALPASRLVVFLFALACALLPGCATAPRAAADDVAVTVTDVRPLEATAFETRLLVTVRLTNQSPRPLTFTGSRHALTLNGRAIGTAVNPDAVELAALTTTTREVTLNVSNFALLGLVREIQRTPSVRYEITSTFFAPGAFARDLRTVHSGSLDLGALAGSGPH
jgi:LEA14-like dessication related protein